MELMEGSKLYANLGYSFMLLLTFVALFSGIATPEWITRDGLTVSHQGKTYDRLDCGVITTCSHTITDVSDCGRYGDQLNDLPISDWQVSAGFLIGAGIVLGFVFLTSIFTCCCCFALQRSLRHVVVLVCICFLVGLLMFTRGLEGTRTGPGTTEPQQIRECAFCGANADRFDQGDCDYGLVSSCVP